MTVIKVKATEINGEIQIPIPNIILDQQQINIGDMIVFDKTEFGYKLRKYDKSSDSANKNISLVEELNL
ncbi:MAG: hypothetical protein EKK54_04350 [Neisseriaceae bacterium]|nr:MAG: hypothetical protein EKK54_04350 [Neisseriaceae bacterium]